jgi:hypothetical protein
VLEAAGNTPQLLRAGAASRLRTIVLFTRMRVSARVWRIQLVRNTQGYPPRLPQAGGPG